MPTLANLTRIFRRALATAIATSATAPVLIEGCGDQGPGIENDPDFMPARCENGSNLWLAGLKPEPPVDFLELIGPVPTQQEGEACKTATMVEACQTKLAELRGPGVMPTPTFWLQRFVDHADSAKMRVTRGDEVFPVGTESELRALLGKIDSPADAMLLTQVVGGFNVECNNGGARASADGFEVQAFQSVGCGGRDRYLIAVSSDGKLKTIDRDRLEDPQRNCVVGRRPAGLRGSARAPCRSAAGYLARAATLEAASVAAFRQLAAELTAHGAPRSLIEAALAAARDEVRHARVTARLARRLGTHPERARIDPTPLRGLEEIARENACEGCVRETFGALEGQWMALRASDPRVCSAYRRIAEDELRHAALSWRVARWIEPRLSDASRRRVHVARRDAMVELALALREEPSAELRDLCGVPSAREAQQLFRELAPALV